MSWKLRQRPQIRWCWRHECLLQLTGYPKIPRAETAPGWTTWELCRSRGQTRRSGRSTPVVTRRHNDQSAFSMLPGEHPIGLLRWPLGSSRYATTESSSVCRLTNEAPAPPKRPGFSRIRRSDFARPEGWVARKRARCVRNWNLASQDSQVPTAVGVPTEVGADRRGQRTGRSDELSASVPVRRLLKPS